MRQANKPSFQRYKCLVCGKPIQKRNTIHYRCQEVDNIYHQHAKMQTAAEKAIASMRTVMFTKIKHWSKSMGMDKLKEMFPDKMEVVNHVR